MGKTLIVKTVLSRVEERKESPYYVLAMCCVSHISPLAFNIESRQVHGSEGGSESHVTCPGPLTHPAPAHSYELKRAGMGEDTLRKGESEQGS